MIANDNKSDLGSLNKLVDEYNNTFYHSIDIMPIDADYSALLEEIETNPKARKFTVEDRVRITNYKKVFWKSCPNSWSKEILFIDSVLKTNPWAYEIKDLNGETITGSFYEKIFVAA